MPILSIIIPSKTTHDVPLANLLSALQRQTFQDYELLIVTEGNSEEAKAIGINQATGEILGFFCTDNDLRDPTFLDIMVRYAQDPAVDGAFTAQYDYVRTDTLLSRYCALLGANDPLCWWLGKADRGSYLSDHYTEIKRFSGRLPSVGDNGFFLKQRCARLVQATPETFGSCMCFCEDLRRVGHATYWVVAEQALWHRTGENALAYFRRRYQYVRDLYFRDYEKRRWRMVDSPQDWLRVVGFVLASVVVLPHLYTSVRGYRRVRDVAWFLHIPVCLGLSIIYGCAWITGRMKR